MTNSIDNPNLTTIPDDEMLNILRRVQSGELNVAEAEQLLGEALDTREEQTLTPLALDSQNFSALLGKTANGKLLFERGAAGLTLRGEPLPGQLFTAHFERQVPIVRVNGGAVTVRYRDFGFGLLNWLRYGFNPPRGEMTLNAGIPWQINFHGGLSQVHLDLELVKLRGATFTGGTSEVELRVGELNGVVNFDFRGGVHNLQILRPVAVAVHLTIHGGATNLALDSQQLGAVGGTMTLETPNSQQALHSYRITVSGGAHNFNVATL